MDILETAPHIIVTENGAAFAETAADFLMEQFRQVSRPLIVLPTGDTPTAVYDSLVARYGHDREFWSSVGVQALDEYLGLTDGDERLFSGELRRKFLDRVQIPLENRTMFQSDAPDPARETARIESLLLARTIDVAVLGLGGNGHLGFNEPGSSFNSRTQIIELLEDTRRANARNCGEKGVPAKAITLGLGNLSEAGRQILLVSGGHKAAILARTLNGPISTDTPSTIIRTWPNATIIADRAAMRLG